MILRLWWKESRVFWPLWIALIVLAALTQGTWVYFVPGFARQGYLVLTALGWASLYGIAVGASAFAGEREARTSAFLSTLPVGQGRIWIGKASFALVSTFLLAVVLVAMGVWSTDPAFNVDRVLLGYGSLILEVVAFGLFWSAFSGTALNAAVLAVVTVILMHVANLDDLIAKFPQSSGANPGPRLWVALAVMAISIVRVAGRDSIVRLGSTRIRVPSPTVARVGTPAAARRIVWITSRESRVVWLTILSINLLAASFHQATTSRNEQSGAFGMIMVLGVISGLMAGVSVFGAENRAQSNRFYAQHGVSPLLHWSIKEGVWLAFFAVFLWLEYVVLNPSLAGTPIDPAALACAAMVQAFFVAQLSGQVIRRTVSAWALGLGVVVVLLTFEAALTQAGLLSVWWLVVPAFVFAFASVAWSGEWMRDGHDRRRLVKLALYVSLPAAFFTTLYVADRAWGVPDVGIPYDTWSLYGRPAAREENAVPLYRRALTELREAASNPAVAVDHSAIERVILDGWDSRARAVHSWLKARQNVVSTTRDAATKPSVVFTTLGRASLFNALPSEVPKLWDLAELLAVDIREKESRDDLAGAWEEIRSLFAMAGQVAETPASLTQLSWAYKIEDLGLRLALDWCAKRDLTIVQLREALRELRGSLPISSPEDSIKVEHYLMERVLSSPGETLRLLTKLNDPSGQAFDRNPLNLALLSPWERERARRVVRQVTADKLKQLRETNSGGVPIVIVRDDGEFIGKSPLARLMVPTTDRYVIEYRRVLTLRRVLETTLAVQIWRREHVGNYPESLTELVPSVLATIPIDPFSGQPLRYFWSQADPTAPLPGTGGSANAPFAVNETRLGRWLLYSVGPDGRDDHATSGNLWIMPNSSGDLVFPISE